MEKIALLKIEIKENRIKYHYYVSDGLNKYFKQTPFMIDYPENMEEIPDAVAAVPFVCNVLPIVWLTNANLFIPELDEDFLNCIDEVRKGYEMMFPETSFKGSVSVNTIVTSPARIADKCAAFYSGGLDSIQTLISHIQEKPTLISIWGSDIAYDNNTGWELVYSAIQEASCRFDIPNAIIHSTFREFDNENLLDTTFHQTLHDGWWHGVKHGIGLLGHVAPYAYLHGITIMYIASSNCPKDGVVRCASSPWTDNNVRFAGCRVVHDGYEYNRQNKVHNVVSFCRERNEPIPMHVCWQSQSGGNCCRCEKCFRTIAGLLAEGENPAEYGFPDVAGALDLMQIYLIEWEINRNLLKKFWVQIHDRIKENQKELQNEWYWSKIKWIAKADFSKPEKLRMPYWFRVKRKLKRVASSVIVSKKA